MRIQIGRLLLRVVLVVIMVAATTLLHVHAWSQSHQDLGCAGISDPGQPCHCGWAYSAEFPVQFLPTTVLLIAGAVYLSFLGSQGRPLVSRLRRAAALAVVAYLAISPLNFSLSDWHGDLQVLYGAPLTLLSLPLSIPLWPALMRLGASYHFPYLGGDPVFGKFSTCLAVDFFVLGVCAYVQWFILVPWLRGYIRRRRAMTSASR